MKKAGDSLSQWLGMLLVATLILPGMGWAAENQPPSATAKTATFNEDTKATITLSGKDPERKTLGYVLASQPSHGTVSLKGNKVTYTPAPNYFGADSFTYLVNDGVLDSAPAMVSLTIRAVNDKPVADAASFVAIKDTASEFTLSGSDIEDGKTLVFQPGAKSKKGGTVRLKQGNVVTYTPKKGFVGADSFTFTVKDSGRAVSVAATVKVDVMASKPNNPPIANAGSDQTVVEKVSINLDGSSSSDNDGSIASYAWAQVSGDAVTLTGADTATPSFTAPVVNNTEGSKVLTFGLRVTDKEGASSADTVIITVNAVNENPMADAGADQEVDEKSSVSLSGSATDPDGDTTTYSWTQTDSSGLSVTLTGANTATPSFTAPAVGSDTTLIFTLTVSDGHDGMATDTVSVLVKNVPNAPPMVNAGEDQTLDEKTSVTLSGSGTDTDGSIASHVWTQTAGDSVTLTGADAANPSFIASTVSNTDGSKTLTFKLAVTDNEGATGEDSVTITVNAVNENPTANAGTDQEANENTSVSLGGSATDPDGDTPIYSWAQTDSTGVTVTLTDTNTATLSFTAPAVNANTKLTFTLTVSDGHGGTATDTVDIRVANRSTASSAYPAAPDQYEGSSGDNSFENATTLGLDELQPRTLFPGGEVDFVRIELMAGVTYEFSANNLCYLCDTILGLYDAGHNELAGDDDYLDYDSNFRYTPTETGTYYLRVSNFSSDSQAVAAYTLGFRELVDADSDGFSSYYDCDDTDSSIYPFKTFLGGRAPEIAGDGIDQSCNGVDRLTNGTPDTFENDDDFGAAKPFSYMTGQDNEVQFRAFDTFIPNARTIDTPNDADYFSIVVDPYSWVGFDYLERAINVSRTIYDANFEPLNSDYISNQSAVSRTYYVKFTSSEVGWYVPFAWKRPGEFRDLDGDGYPVATVWPYSAVDCDDTNSAINPDATELPNDGIDANCDGDPNGRPYAEEGADQTANAGTTVTLDGSGSYDTDGTIVTYQWTQDSGESVVLTGASSVIASFVAPMVTEQIVLRFTLQVTDNDGATHSDYLDVTVNPVVNQPPIADAGVDQSVVEGNTVNLDGTASYDPDNANNVDSAALLTNNGILMAQADTVPPFSSNGKDIPFLLPAEMLAVDVDKRILDKGGKRVRSADVNAVGSIVSYAWTQIAGDSVTLNGVNTVTPSFTAPRVTNIVGSKTLAFKLTVTDDTGATGEDTVTVTVNAFNENPTANAGVDQEVVENANVTLNGSGTDPDSDTVTYSWVQTSGTPSVTLTGAATATPAFVAPSVTVETILTFTLTVSDGYGGTATDSIDVIVKAKPTNAIVSLEAGEKHTCVVVAGGVQCWGRNSHGQLGNGSIANRSLTPVQALPDGSGATAVNAGGVYTCAVVAGGVQCWGINDYGQLGDGSTINRTAPVQVLPAGSGVSAIGVGYHHSCAVLNGGLQCWGRNDYGQLGDGSKIQRHSPVQVLPAGSGVTAVTIGTAHTCAAVAGGMRCWGWNGYGQLGDGSTTDSSTPVQVIPNGSGIISIGAGGWHTCAAVNGGVQCWGANFFGQLGDGSTTARLVPTWAIPTGSGVNMIGVGYHYSCAELNGGVQCWGQNLFGQLGDGTTTQRSSPMQTFPSGSGVTSLTVGQYVHTCVLINGNVQCVGGNDYGQLGDGTTTNRYAPVNGPLFSGGTTNRAPIVNAGTDQQVDEGATVNLSGSGTDPDGDTVTYSWAQTDSSGVTATLTGATTATPSFTAPTVDADTTLTFTLTVSDGHGGTATDTVNVLVRKNVVVQPTPTGKLNDTGITLCGDYAYDASGNTVSGHTHSNSQDCNLLSDAEGDPIPPSLRAAGSGQDGYTGRDVTANDDSDGHAGFSFTKISSTGAALPADASEWSCVKDNVTGLIWEVKTDDGGLHDKDDRYTWYESDGTKNGGFAGYQKWSDYNASYSDAICYGHTAGNAATYCNTKAYVDRVNVAGWCGATDWRLPRKEELRSIVSYDRYNPAIDTAWFPNTPSAWFWSASPNSNDVNSAWHAAVGYGYVNNINYPKSHGGSVRLVRSGQGQSGGGGGF